MVYSEQDKIQGASLLLQTTVYCAACRSDENLSTPLRLGDSTFFDDTLAAFRGADHRGDIDAHTPLALRRVEGSEPQDEASFFYENFRSNSLCHQDPCLSLLVVILNAARRVADPQLFFHYWLSEKLRQWLGPRGFQDPDFVDIVKTLRHRVHRMLALGINLRGRNPKDFLAARYDGQGTAPCQADDGGVILDNLVSSASFAGAGLLETIEVLTLAPGARMSSCATFGLLAGSFYGQERVLRLETYGRPFAEYFPQHETTT